MTMEEKLAYLQKAIEKGATIRVSFYGISNQNEAKKEAAEFSEMLGAEAECGHSGDYTVNWVSVDKEEEDIETTFFFKGVSV